MVQLLYDGSIGVSVQFCTQDWSKWLLLLREQGGSGEFHLPPMPAEAVHTAGGRCGSWHGGKHELGRFRINAGALRSVRSNTLTQPLQRCPMGSAPGQERASGPRTRPNRKRPKAPIDVRDIARRKSSRRRKQSWRDRRENYR